MLFVVAGLLLGCQAESATHQAVKGAAMMAPVPGSGVLLVTGPIDESFSARLQKILARHPAVDTIEIESGGGWVGQVSRAAGLLNAKRIAVRVRGHCASACAVLWAAANRRELIEGARIGLHDSRYVEKRTPPRILEGALERRRQQLTAFEYRALKHAGFSDALIRRGNTTSPDDVLWLTSAQLGREGVRFSLRHGSYARAGAVPVHGAN